VEPRRGIFQEERWKMKTTALDSLAEKKGYWPGTSPIDLERYREAQGGGQSNTIKTGGT